MSDTAKNTFLQDLGGSHPTDWPSCIWLNTAYQRGGGIYGQVYAIYSPTRETIAVRPYTPNQSCGVRPVIEVKKQILVINKHIFISYKLIIKYVFLSHFFSNIS